MYPVSVYHQQRSVVVQQCTNGHWALMVVLGHTMLYVNDGRLGADLGNGVWIISTAKHCGYHSIKMGAGGGEVCLIKIKLPPTRNLIL